MAELFFKFAKSANNFTLKNTILNWAAVLHVSFIKLHVDDTLLIWNLVDEMDHCKKGKFYYIEDSDTEDFNCSKLAERQRRSSATHTFEDNG